MKNRFLFAAMALLALFAVSAGIYTTGGPMAARLERQDVELLQDLNTMARRLRCKAPDVALPDPLTGDALQGFCNGDYRNWGRVNRKMPEVDVTYHRLNDTSFKLCATFHDATRQGIQARYSTGFDPKTGCQHGTIR